jgi:hypothetical protein
MNAAGVKNIILMFLIILILHFLIKNIFLERSQRRRESSKTGAPDCIVACKEQCTNNCVVVCDKDENQSTKELANADEHDELKKFVFEDFPTTQPDTHDGALGELQGVGADESNYAYI